MREEEQERVSEDAIEVWYCYAGFPRSRALLRERLTGTRFRFHAADPARPLEAQVGEASVLIPSMARITRTVMEAAPRLKLIVQFGAGLEGVDREAASERGIVVRNVPGANAQAVAELAVFLMLALSRRLPLHARSFSSRVVGDPVGHELQGKTVGIVGLGASGRALARIARGFGMEVIATRKGGAADPLASWVGTPPELPALLAQADFVSLHAPASPETQGLIGSRELALMKPTAFLINVGRGPLVDRSALVEALGERRIGGAGLDVFWEEPPDPEDPLFALDNVVTTPHVGGVTEEALGRIADRVVAIIAGSLVPAAR
ncbi:MAG TPA: 2-hydroxyacid dehydrogenase [Vicinamibacteria bacterium]|nr:2-hydroxyacid dehydrogenase [Vicinamibacteria bacterium]